MIIINTGGRDVVIDKYQLEAKNANGQMSIIGELTASQFQWT